MLRRLLKHHWRKPGIIILILTGLYGLGRLVSLIPQLDPVRHLEASQLQLTWWYIWAGAALIMLLILIAIIIGMMGFIPGDKNEQNDRAKQ